LSQCNYFGPCNFGVFASYYTETILYSNFRGLLFSRTCQAREIREIKGTRKKTGFTVFHTARHKTHKKFVVFCFRRLGHVHMHSEQTVRQQCSLSIAQHTSQELRYCWDGRTMLCTSNNEKIGGSVLGKN